MNLVEIEPGGQIPEHTEAERDHEEVFVVLRGDALAVIDGVEHAAAAISFVRVDPACRRTIRNVGTEPVQLLIASARRRAVSSRLRGPSSSSTGTVLEGAVGTHSTVTVLARLRG